MDIVKVVYISSKTYYSNEPNTSKAREASGSWFSSNLTWKFRFAHSDVIPSFAIYYRSLIIRIPISTICYRRLECNFVWVLQEDRSFAPSFPTINCFYVNMMVFGDATTLRGINCERKNQIKYILNLQKQLRGWR